MQMVGSGLQTKQRTITEHQPLVRARAPAAAVGAERTGVV